MAYYIIDSETGEIINEVEPGDKLIKKGMSDFLKSTIVINSAFIKIFTENIIPVLDILKDGKNRINVNAIMIMFYLMKFIHYRTGLLQHDNGQPLTNKYIIEDLNCLSRGEIYKNLKFLKDKGIITIVLKENKQQYYMFNPFIACSGKRIDATHIHTFLNTKFANNLKSKN